MHSFNRKLWIIAGILSVISTFLIYKYLVGLKVPEQQNLVKVYVASQTIPPRSLIVKEMLEEEEIPIEYVHPEAVREQDKILGKITTSEVIAGEQIITSRLAQEQKGNLSYRIPKDKRAVTINANEVIIVANLIKPGDHVDILVTIEEQDITTEDGDTIIYPSSTKTVLQDIQVLAVGQNMDAEMPVPKEMPVSVTLAVSCADAEKLVFAEEVGRIRLTLRPIMEEGHIDTPGATISHIATQPMTIKSREVSQGGDTQ